MARGKSDALDEDIIAADHDATKARSAADIAAAKAVAARTEEQRAHVTLLMTQRDALDADFDRMVGTLISIADEIDDEFARVQELLAACAKQAEAARLVQLTRLDHNGSAINPDHNNNEFLRSIAARSAASLRRSA